jgi:hypothetical protein
MAMFDPGLGPNRIVTLVLMYVGPEVLLPITSALAAIGGLALMFWNKVVGAAKGTWRFVSRRKPE